MPSLEKLHQRFKGKPFTMLAIDVQEDSDTVRKNLKKIGVTYPNLLDRDGQISAMYGVRSTPMKFLIDGEGNMVGAAMGYREWDQEEMTTLIEILLNK